ncbi:PCRF domain-containing protein, partial [Rhizobium sp.]
MAKLPVEKMRELERRFGEIEARMSAGPAADVYVKLASEYSELEPVVKKIRDYEKAVSEASDLEALLADRTTDKDMRDLAEMELPEVESRISELEKDMQVLLLPKDAADEKSAILEIRAGTGGSEAALFAGDLFRMYERFASTKG